MAKLREISKSSQTHSIQEKSKVLLRKWRAIFKQQSTSSSSSSNPTKSSTNANNGVATLKISLGGGGSRNSGGGGGSSLLVQEEEEEELDDGRKITKDLFTPTLKHPRSQIAFKIAQSFRQTSSFNLSLEMSKAVELAVNQLFSQASKSKEYMAKARQMMFNLRENESLRLQVASGIIEPRGLVRMSIEDLAGSQQQVQKKMENCVF